MKLERSHRTIALPSPIRLDTVPPSITVQHPQYPIISPDGDGHARRLPVPLHDRTSRRTRSSLRARTAGRCSRATQKHDRRARLERASVEAGQARPRPAATCSRVSAQDTAGNRSKAYPFAIVQIRYVDARALARRRRAGRPVRAPGLDRRAEGPLAAARPLGRQPRGTLHFRAPKSQGRLPPLRRSPARTRRAPRWWSDERAASAQAAGAVGASGSRCSLVAPRRDLRIAGLAAWAVGCAGLAVYLAPHGHHRLLAAAAVVGASLAAAVGAWLVAARARGCSRSRRSPACRRGFPVHVGSTQANLLLPLYGVVVVAALALAWELFGDDRRVRASSGRSRGRSRCSSAGTGCRCSGRRTCAQGAIELLFFVLPFGLLALALARLAVVARAGC